MSSLSLTVHFYGIAQPSTLCGTLKWVSAYGLSWRWWMWLVAVNFRRTCSPSWLAWSDDWRPPGSQSTFIRWTRWTLAMTLVMMIAPSTLSWLLLLLLVCYTVVAAVCGTNCRVQVKIVRSCWSSTEALTPSHRLFTSWRCRRWPMTFCMSTTTSAGLSPTPHPYLCLSLCACPFGMHRFTGIPVIKLFSVSSVLWRCWLCGRKGIRPVKNWVVGCWRGYLSGERCKLAYGPADATATHCLFSKIHIGCTFLVPAHPGSPGQTAVKRVCCCCYVLHLMDYSWLLLFCWPVKCSCNSSKAECLWLVEFFL